MATDHRLLSLWEKTLKCIRTLGKLITSDFRIHCFIQIWLKLEMRFDCNFFTVCRMRLLKILDIMNIWLQFHNLRYSYYNCFSNSFYIIILVLFLYFRIQYLFKPRPGENHRPHSFYRSLYPRIIKDIDSIESNWRNGKHVLQKINCRSENSKGVYCLQYDDQKIVSGLRDNTIKIWDRTTLQCTKVRKHYTLSPSYFFIFKCAYPRLHILMPYSI